MTMLLLLLAVFLAAAQAQCPERCMCEVLDQLEYDCDVIQVRARKNDYINLQCTSANVTCDDIPSIDLAGNKTIRSLGVKDCPPSVLQCISGAFGVSGVYKLTFTRPTEEIRPEDLVGYQDVDYMMLREGKETTIPIHLLPSLPALKDWRIADGALTLSTLPSQPFSNYSEVNIKLLEISTNGIKDVPQGMFEGLNGLLKLDFWGNKVERLRLNSLKGLDSLTRLNLNVNNLSGIEVGTLTDVPNVKEIYLTKNRFSDVPSGLFAGLDKLEIIDFTMNLVPLILQNSSFSNLPSLKTLYFNDSEIHTISENTFLGSKNITVLSLTSNKLQFLPPNLFLDQSNLKILDLSKNKLEKLSDRVFVGLKELEYLNLDGNQLKSLPDFLFSGLRNLKTVSLNHNFLKTFTDSTFQGAVALETLSIENNKLTIIDKNESNNPLYMSYEQNSPFSSLVNLKRLLLKYNELDTIYNDWRYVLLNLQLLDLSHNFYTDLQEFEVQFLAKDVVVDLRNNRIATVQLYYAPYPPTNSPPQNTTNSKILLANNPLNCDCVIYQLVKRLRGAKSETVEPTFDLTDTYCVKPVNLQGKPVKKLDLFDLTCDFDDDCPNNCTCNVRPETATAEFDCRKIPVNLIPIPNHKVVLRLHEQPANIDNLNVDILNLTGLNIETVNFKPVTGLETIDLSDNSLKIPPVQLLDSNLTLFLKGNPFECDCWSYNELNLLKENHKFIKDYNEISCSNGVAISELNVVALCDALKTGIIATSTFVTLILIVCIVIIICTKYSNEIIIFMAYKSVFRKIFYIENLDSDKKHDVFLSFSHKDIKFVEEQLLTKLEDEFKLNVCIHYRDWNVGEYISTQILRSVESSRRTIIVLSKNFLESNWAKAEFNVAHNLTLKDNVARVILILLEDVTKDPNLTDELKAYINMNTYLMHGDPRFWQKLKKALPQRKIKFKWQNRMETTPEKTLKGGLDVQLNSKNQLVNMVAKEV